MEGNLGVRLRRTCDAAKAASTAAADTRAVRDAVVYEAYEYGWKYREIATEADGQLSVSQVQRIIDAETARRQQAAAARVP